MSEDPFDRSRLIDSKGRPVVGNVVNSNNVLPLLNHGYNKYNLEQEIKLVPPLSFDKILDAPVSMVANLNVQPGDKGFIFWFVISSLVPLVSACVAPIANMISIIGLAEAWRADTATGKIISDPIELRVLNILSLCFGLIGNISLFVNFRTTKMYIIAQTVSIFSWIVACILLLVAVLLLAYRLIQEDQVATEGYWLSLFTIVFYFSCTITMSLNCLGFILGKYPPLLNLNKTERDLMIYTAVLAFWLVIGALVVKHLVDGISYGAGLYFCMVSVLTIGLGDILPTKNGARAFILIFSLVGVILLGLVISMIRQVLHNTQQPVFLWHRMEVERKKVLKVIKKRGYTLTNEEAFKIMRKIDHKLKAEKEMYGLLVSLLIFCVFWLVGAVVFHYVENWSYFQCVYFCLLCLITIGYGDFAPETALGRVFFITWAVSAVPLMTILISNMGDTLFGSTGVRDLLVEIKYMIQSLFAVTTKTLNKDPIIHDLETFQSSSSSETQIKPDPGIDEVLEGNSQIYRVNQWKNSCQFEDEELAEKVRTQRKGLVNILDFLNQLKPILEDTLDTPSMEYDHQQWSKLIRTLKKFEEFDFTPMTWLGDDSPLRLPLQEPNYFISRIFFRIESELLTLIKNSDKELEDLLKKES